MTIPDSIHDLIMRAVASKLTLELVTNNPDADLRPGLIRPGRLQDDPETPRISILIFPGDPSDTSSRPVWTDGPAIDGVMEGWTINAGYQIGGGGMQFRRFCMDINCYFTATQESREDAQKKASWVLKSVQNALHEWNPAVSDHFGESTVQLYMNKPVPIESGGPPDSFIWRTKYFFSVLTEMP